MQPDDVIPTAEPVITPTPSNNDALSALRMVFDTLDGIVADQSKGASQSQVNHERFRIRKLRDRVVTIIRKLDDDRSMPRVPEGGES